jgi:hypothetical protein
MGISQAEELEDIAADLSFRVAQLYHFLNNELGQEDLAFLIQHALTLVGELSFYNKLLADKCRSEDSIATAKEVLRALARAVIITQTEDPGAEQMLEADAFIIQAQATLYNKARQCLGL